jgi:hypothetical protein
METKSLISVLLVFMLFSCIEQEKDISFKIYHLKPNDIYKNLDRIKKKGRFDIQRNDFFVVKNYDSNNEQHKIKIDSFVVNQIKKDAFLTTNNNSSWSLTFFKYGNGIDEYTEHISGTDYAIHNLFSYKKEIGGFYFDNRAGYASSFYRTAPEKLDKNKREIISNYFKEFDSIVKNNEDITGEYELVNGKAFNFNSEDDKIFRAAIIIEKLSETDFGFYAVNKIKDIKPSSDFGVIRKFVGNYYNLSICDEEWVEGYTKSNFTNGIYLHNQMIIEKRGDLLVMIRYGSNFRSYMLYKKKKSQANFNSALVKTLKSSKLYYEQFLLDYEKAKHFDEDKLRIEYVFRDSLYKTKHYHNEDYANIETTHSYQNPYQKGKFIEQDSIFMSQLERY